MTRRARTAAGIARPAAVAAALMAAAVGGCAVPPPMPQDNYYRLQAAAPAVALERPRFAGVLLVERFSADGVVAGRPINYVDSRNPGEMHEYHYHFWTQAPGIMLQDELVSYLRRRRMAAMVVTPEMRVEPDYAISAKVRRLERIVGAVPTMVVLEMDMALRRGADRKLVLLETYRLEKEAGADSVAAAVTALNDVLTEAFERFAAALERS